MPRCYRALALLASCLLAISGATAKELEKASELALGQVIYSLYQGDHASTLSTIARFNDAQLTDQHAQVLRLIEGGESLSYGMSKHAAERFEQLLNQQHSSAQIKANAWYWLAKLSFEQQLYDRAQQAYGQLAGMAKLHQESPGELLSESQWRTLNYQMAHIGLLNQQENWQSYINYLDKSDIELLYLSFNQAVLQLQQDNVEQAVAQLAQATATLAATPVSAAVKRSWWRGWFGWFSDSEQSQKAVQKSIDQQEWQALANQIYLTQGQAYLADGNLEQALLAFGQVQGSSLIRDQALLNFAWGMSKQGNWSMALSVWDYLAAQQDNLYSLQAQHALALGYAHLGAQQQAFTALDGFVRRIQRSIQSLDNLQTQLAQPRAMLALAEGVQANSTLSANEAEQAVGGVWPLAHADLLLSLMTSDDKLFEQQHMVQVVELYRLLDQLVQSRITVDQFRQLLLEREVEHQRRAQQLVDQQQLQSIHMLQQQVQAIQQQIAQANAQIHSGDSNTVLAAHRLYANDTQLEWLTRLTRSQQRLARLAEERAIKPSYTQRLRRLNGILAWQLSEAFPAQHWQHKQALLEVQALLEQAKLQHQRLQTLTQSQQNYADQHERVERLSAQIEQQSAVTRQLIVDLEVQIRKRALTLIAERREYLKQQHTLSRLAMLQMQDQQAVEVSTEQASADAQELIGES